MSERQQLFGTDLQLVEYAGGLDLGHTNLGDLQLAHGNANIVQALRLRLLVRRGELAALGWPSYGSRLHELIGAPNTRRTHLRAAAFARSAVEQDPRVREVSEVRVLPITGERSLLRLQLEVSLIDAPNPLNLVFDLALEAT